VYDNATQHRLLRIVDALGQQTTLSYLSDSFQNGTNANFYKISKVTDPWGRQASFTYNNPNPTGTDTAQLAAITDEGGLMSQFTYANDSSGFMTAMGTPYGTTAFATGYIASDLWQSRSSSCMGATVAARLKRGRRESIAPFCTMPVSQ